MLKNVFIVLGFVGMIFRGVLLAFGNTLGIGGLVLGFLLLEVTLGSKG